MRPAARPAALRAQHQPACTQGDFPVVSAAKEAPLGYPLRISATHLDDICSALAQRDWEVLNFVSACRLVSGKQLVRQFWQTGVHDDASARAGRRTLKRLASWRVLDPLPGRTVGGLRGGSQTIVYGVGVAGARLLARRGLFQKRLGTPGDRHVRHTLAVTELVVALHEADRAGLLELIHWQTEPACWRGFIGAGGSRIVLKPDLFVRIGAGSVAEDRWMVEMDMATEASSTIRAKAQRHLTYWRSGSEPVNPRVLWVAPDQRRADQITETLRLLPAPANHLFAICPAHEVVAYLAAEARS
jgi:protein involved in plasmid replication-relaxation